MTKTVDCFLIGHNTQPLEEYEKNLKNMGDPYEWREFERFTLRYDNRSYRIMELLNTFYCKRNSVAPLKMGDVFSNTIAYLGTFLHRRGLTFDFVNSFRGEKKELAEKLSKENILTIAVTTTLYTAPFPIIEIIRFIRKYNRTAKIIIGGPHIFSQARCLPRRELEALLQLFDADFVVNSHQGETALVNIIRSLKQNLSLKQISNIWYKTDKGFAATPILTEDNNLMENMIKWELFADRIGEFVNVRTATGCPFSCAFCTTHEMNRKKYRCVGVEAMEKELNSLNRIESIKYVIFIDDTFNVPPEQFKERLRMLGRNNYRFKWISLFRCQFADEETVRMMKETGCVLVFLGLESGNNHVLKNMNKKVAVEEYHKGIALLKKYGILTFGSFVVGFPGETRESISDTVNFINKTGLDFCNLCFWYCSKIAPIWEKREQYNLEGEGCVWKHLTMDSKTADYLIEEMILSIDDKQTALVRDGRFDMEIVPFMVNRGMSVKQIKEFLRVFTAEIKKKLLNPGQETDLEVFRSFEI
ncbi:MAG: radical SAM protein [Desulfobacteraceae bacterium]|nr:radical SAM protein [Desulfobacteraceae bacterium]